MEQVSSKTDVSNHILCTACQCEKGSPDWAIGCLHNYVIGTDGFMRLHDVWVLNHVQNKDNSNCEFTPLAVKASQLSR